MIKRSQILKSLLIPIIKLINATCNKQIHMVSFWRDSYGMIVHEKGKPDQYVTFEKINGANVYGGPDCVVDTIEHLYKIRIDGWVMTDFSKFKNLIAREC